MKKGEFSASKEKKERKKFTNSSSLPRDRGLDPVVDAEEALRGALPRAELLVDRVDVRGQQSGPKSVGASDQDRGNARDVGGQARRDERAHELRRRDEDLASQVAALLLRGELVLEVDAGGACWRFGKGKRKEKSEFFPSTLKKKNPTLQKKRFQKDKNTYRPQSCSSSSRSS